MLLDDDVAILQTAIYFHHRLKTIQSKQLWRNTSICKMCQRNDYKPLEKSLKIMDAKNVSQGRLFLESMANIFQSLNIPKYIQPCDDIQYAAYRLSTCQSVENNVNILNPLNT